MPDGVTVLYVLATTHQAGGTMDLVITFTA